MKELLFALLVVGSASQTGVVRINDDTYMIGAQNSSGFSSSAVKSKLYREATQFCLHQDRKFVQVDGNAVDFTTGRSAGVEIQFRCE